MFTKMPFQINYPLEIFNYSREINFKAKEEREELYSRNIYYYLFNKTRNGILEKKHGLFLDLKDTVIDYMNQTYPEKSIFSISLFGSSLIVDNPRDYDFLVITQGDTFLLDEKKLMSGGKEFQVGMSIKGLDNYLRGFQKKDNLPETKKLEQIIDRTAISLFRRHIPIFGHDFLENKIEFLKNAYAQVSDLVNNSYELFYLDHDFFSITPAKRGKKMLTRCYEATSYLGAVDDDVNIMLMREKIYNALNEPISFDKSKKIFEEFGQLYESKVEDKRNASFRRP